MSLELAHINSISLNESNYGEHLNDRFATIDRNFKTIVGTDYLKGNQGDSIHIDEFIMDPTNTNKFGLYLNDEDLSPKSLYELVRNAILDGINELEDTENGYLNSIIANGETIKWDDSLTKNNRITIVYKLDKDTNRKIIISSLQYTFSDNRFNNLQFVSNYDIYEGLLDMSCIVCIQNTQNENGYNLSFKKLNTFPTIYYNSDVENSDNPYQGTFCWVMNGNKTEIPATGPRGKDGTASSVYVTRVNSRDGSNKCYVTHVYVIDKKDDDDGVVAGGKFVTLEEFLNKDYNAGHVYDLTFDSNTFVFAIKENQSAEDFGDKVWVSPLIIEKSPSGVINYYALCDDSNCIMGHYNSNNLQKWMMSMYNSSTLKGLFLPITASGNLNGVETQSAHLIYAEGTDSKTRLVISPMYNVLDPDSTTKYEGATMYIDYDTTIKNLTIEGEGNKLVVGNKATTELEKASIKNLTIEGEGNKLVVGNKATTELETVNVGKLIISDNTCILSDENDIDGNIKYAFEYTSDEDGITKVRGGNPIGSDENDEEEGSIYHVYFKDNTLFDGDVKMGGLATNSVDANNIVAKENISCHDITTEIIDTKNISSEYINTENITSNSNSNFCNNLFIKQDSVSINKGFNVLGDSVFNSGHDGTNIQLHPDETLSYPVNKGEVDKWVNDEKPKFNENIIKQYSQEGQQKFEKLNNYLFDSKYSDAAGNSDFANSFFEMWKNPLINVGDKWQENPLKAELPVSYKIWENKNDQEIGDRFKITFPQDLSIPITISGRNIRSEGVWGKEWIIPKLEGMALQIILSATYKDGSVVNINEGKIQNGIIFNEVVQAGQIFGDQNKNVFDEDKIKKTENKDKGDTVLYIARASLPEYVIINIQNSQNLKQLNLSIALVVTTSRNEGKADQRKSYECFRSLKVLGILGCNKSNDNKLSINKITSLYNNEKKYPIEYLGSSDTDKKNAFDLLIKPNNEKTYNTTVCDLSEGYYLVSQNSDYKQLHLFNDGIGIVSNDTELYIASGVPSYVGNAGGFYTGNVVKDTYIRVSRRNENTGDMETKEMSLYDIILKAMG